MPHVNQLVDEFGKKGLVVVGVCDDTDAQVEGYIEETGTKMVIAQEPGLGSMRAFGFGGFPSSALVDPKGKVVWTGHPASLTSSIIEKNLKGVRMSTERGLKLSPEMPKKYARIGQRMEKGELGAAWADLDKALGGVSLKEEDRPGLEAAVEMLKTLAKDQNDAANAAKKEGRYALAERVYEDLVKHYKGHGTADTAQISLAELVADETIRDELAAGRKVLEAEDLVAEGKAKKALDVLADIFEGPLANTAEAAKAKEFYEDLKAGD